MSDPKKRKWIQDFMTAFPGLPSSFPEDCWNSKTMLVLATCVAMLKYFSSDSSVALNSEKYLDMISVNWLEQKTITPEEEEATSRESSYMNSLSIKFDTHASFMACWMKLIKGIFKIIDEWNRALKYKCCLNCFLRNRHDCRRMAHKLCVNLLKDGRAAWHLFFYIFGELEKILCTCNITGDTMEIKMKEPRAVSFIKQLLKTFLESHILSLENEYSALCKVYQANFRFSILNPEAVYPIVVWRDLQLAAAMGTHRELGKHSILFSLSPEIIQLIFSLI